MYLCPGEKYFENFPNRAYKKTGLKKNHFFTQPTNQTSLLYFVYQSCGF